MRTLKRTGKKKITLKTLDIFNSLKPVTGGEDLFSDALAQGGGHQ